MEGVPRRQLPGDPHDRRRRGAFTATAHEVRGTSTLDWVGAATITSDRVLTVTRLDSNIGITGALSSDHSRAVSHEYVASFDAAFGHADVKILAVAPSGTKTQVGSATLDASAISKIPGDMIALGESTLDKALHKELDLDKDFGFLSYAHVGVKAGAQLLSSSDETADMKAGDATFRAAGKGDPIWIKTLFEGGPRVDWSKSFPVDPAAALNLDFGFEVGARVHYECEDQYKEPAGITDGSGLLNLVESLPAETFALPLSAETALALPQGSHRLLDGLGSVAISGGASVGYRLAELGILDGHADVDLSAGLGVHWSLGGNLQVEVTREGPHSARVKWTRVASRDFGANASLVIGLALDQTAVDAASSLVTNDTKTPASATNAVVNAIVKSGQNYTQVKFSFSADWTKSDQLEVEALFDLSNPAAKGPYEAAIRGNMTVAQDLGANGPAQGVLECKVTSTLTDALATDTEFSVFNLLSYHHDSRTASVRVDVKTADGTHSVTNMDLFDENTNHLFGGKDSLEAVSTNRTVELPKAAPVVGQRVDFKATHQDGADSGDIRNDLAIGSLLLGDSASADLARLQPAKDQDYGTATLAITLSLGQTAMGKILATSENDFYAAYGRTFVGKGYSWTPDRVKTLSKTSLVQDKNNNSAQEAQRLEAWDWREARTIYGYIKSADKSGKTLADKLDAFPAMAKENGYNLRAIATFAVLAGGQDEQASFSLSAKNVSFSKTVGTVSALPNQP
ncbi:MAG TPA: hypothetical protein VFF73_29515 [Planctomycetota bacterium]|nr:hypothetical protein [Planctomycetota bacterium]